MEQIAAITISILTVILLIAAALVATHNFEDKD
jgi:hypothetical protein